MFTPTPEQLTEARVSPEVAAASDGMVLYRKRGCPRCGQTGYRGRIGIFQFLKMTEALGELAVKRASRDEIAREAMGNGMRSLWDDGMAKVAAGLTSVEELARVTV
jgi:type II secretory ATPase GspE/PulE/Tfp pilus assembly ATPase PilB-like protein